MTVDMPIRLRKVGMAIEKLPAVQAQAVVLKHMVYRDGSGRIVENRKKAEVLRVSLDTFNARVRAGERTLLKWV